MKTTKPSVTINTNSEEVHELYKLVAEGEGQHLEFKHKISHPEKVVREMIAFANSEGGTILIGVDDDGQLVGVKYPDEELMTLTEALQGFLKQPLVYHDSLIKLSEKRSVLRLDIPPSDKPPIYFWLNKNERESYVRVNDMSIKASKEMNEIVRRKKQKKDIRFYFANHELALMKYLDSNPFITLFEFQKLSGLSQFAASRKLILLVLANVLKITATEKGDRYSRL
ncbi:MAG: ATP-binding protein [Cyclobacteriaceae bacterium]